MLVTIRPNLNHKGHVTIHKGTLGPKIDSVPLATILASHTVIRPAGQKLLQQTGKRSVHAGIVGTLIQPIQPNPNIHPRILYHHSLGFTLQDGSPYLGGGTVSQLGIHAYLISK